ncbi:MAG: hypothetical protein ACKVOR_05610 [Flavobacteriales bacterium]
MQRRLPQSNTGRGTALTAAKSKKDSAGTVNILKADTTARLDAHQPLYEAAQNALSIAEVTYHLGIAKKNEKLGLCYMFVSHYLQVFNLAVARGEAPKEHRAFFKIDINSAAVPDISTDEKLLKVADDVVKGDVNRVAAGGIAILMPTIAQVTAAYNAYKQAYDEASTKLDALDAAQEALVALNTEADAVIRKAWADIEGQFAEEEPASRRANSTEWGVVYINVSDTGAIQTVNVTGTNADASPNTLYTARLDLADVHTAADPLGKATLATEEVGADTLIIIAPGKVTQNLPVNLIEGATLEVAVVLVDI